MSAASASVFGSVARCHLTDAVEEMLLEPCRRPRFGYLNMNVRFEALK